MTEKILKAMHIGELKIGKIVIPCAVLEDGTRILRERSVATVLGRKGGGSYWQKKKEVKGALLPEYLAVQNIDPFIGDELRKKLLKPTIYEMKSGLKPKGLPAELLPEICNVWLEAREKSALTDSQKKVAKKAEILMRALAHVGIIALVDEATGFIENKEKFEYRELFKEFVREQAAQYEKQFPDPFYDLLYKLYKYPKQSKKNQHPLFFAKLTRKYVYEPLAGSNGAILEMLDEQNPVLVTISGAKKRKYKLFQFLEKIGTTSLQQHMWQLIGIGKASPNKTIFDRNFNRTFSKNFQKEMFEE